MPAPAGATEAAPTAADNEERDATSAAAAHQGPEAPRRLVVQRALFRGPTDLLPDDLYSQVVSGAVSRARHRAVLAPASHLTTNTYFGRVHATYWQRWTDVVEMEASLLVSGTGVIRLHASDTNKVARVVDTQAVSEVDGAVIVLRAPVDRFVDGGGLWLEFSTDAGALEVSDVRWTVDAAAPARDAAVVICTYNRVDDCLNTLQAMLDDPEPLDCIRVVHVVDQGSDPLESRERFADIVAGFGERLDYIRQPNLGGAGGFTRGIYEVLGEDRAGTDIVLMDDDVQLEPEILIRLTAFANRTTTPTIVGGQMLNLLHPIHLHISAETADFERFTAGLPVPDAVRDFDLLGTDEHGKPNTLERRVDTEYNGWWTCLIPSEVVAAVGYPLPVFFQWDDIEFGYRARQRGFATVALPGAGVWHADFGWKDWDEWHRFFNFRNGLIAAALRTGFSTRVVVKQVAKRLSQYIAAMQYGLAVTLLEAVEDFLRGPAILDDGSAAAAARIRELRKPYAETTPRTVSELADELHGVPVVRAGGAPGLNRPSAVRAAAGMARRMAKGRVGLVPAGDAHWWHVCTFDRAYVTDMSESGIRVRTRNNALAAELAKRSVTVLRRLTAEAPSVVAEFRAAEAQLTSRENWSRLFDVDS